MGVQNSKATTFSEYQQEYIKELTTRRARGGNPWANLPKFNYKQKKLIESEIKYLGAHGAYDRSTINDIVNMPKIKCGSFNSTRIIS